LDWAYFTNLRQNFRSARDDLKSSTACSEEETTNQCVVYDKI